MAKVFHFEMAYMHVICNLKIVQAMTEAYTHITLQNVLDGRSLDQLNHDML